MSWNTGPRRAVSSSSRRPRRDHTGGSMSARRYSRRDFMRMTGMGGVVFASGLPGCAGFGDGGDQPDFHFVQLSDVHWGYSNPKVNPDTRGTLTKAITAV